MAERDWARSHANWVLTNPDMLHRGLLPGHARWARVLRRLTYVVVDECHAYRGVFGSHVALVLRRLIRLARMYGSDPVFVFASATSADPAGCRRPADRPPGAGRHRGRRAPTRAPTSCSGSRRCCPACEGQDGAPVRRSAPAEAGQDDGRPGGRGRPDADLRPVPARRRADGAVRPAAAGRGGAGTGGQGGRLPGRLPAGGAPGARTRPRLRRAAGGGLDQRPRTRGGHRRAGRRRAGRLPGNPGLGLAAGRPGRSPGRLPAGGPWWSSSPGTIRWTPTWCTTRRRSSAARWRRPSSTRPTRTSSARTWPARRRNGT